MRTLAQQRATNAARQRRHRERVRQEKALNAESDAVLGLDHLVPVDAVIGHIAHRVVERFDLPEPTADAVARVYWEAGDLPFPATRDEALALLAGAPS